MRRLILAAALLLGACAGPCGHGSLSADNANGSDFFLGCHWGGGDYAAFYDQGD